MKSGEVREGSTGGHSRAQGNWCNRTPWEMGSVRVPTGKEAKQSVSGFRCCLPPPNIKMRLAEGKASVFRMLAFWEGGGLLTKGHLPILAWPGFIDS